jgi:uncharacterized membrane protein
MTGCGNLWAIGYDDTERAEQVREEITRLGERHCLILLDTAVAVRYPDGSVTLDGEPFVVLPSIQGRTFANILARLALAVPMLTGAAVGGLQRATCGRAAVEIDEDFIREVQKLMAPGTSALFVLDQGGDMDAILQGIRGLGGTVVKTDVDLERAKLIQSTLTENQQ